MSFNTQKIVKLGAREDIENYMQKHKIDFAALQETGISTNQIEQRKNTPGIPAEKIDLKEKEHFLQE